MGVVTSAECVYGYRVRFEDIPEAEERFDNEFSDLADEPDGWKVTIFGEEYWCSNIIEGDNAYVGYKEQDWYIGPMLPYEATADEFADRCRELEQTTREMYRLVMRKEPTDAPKVHVYTRWW